MAETEQSAGWCASSDPVFEVPHFDFPAISVPRGGIKWPVFSVQTLITPAYLRRWMIRRTVWHLNIRYFDGTRHMLHFMEFTNEPAARNAEQIIKFMMQSANEQFHKKGKK